MNKRRKISMLFVNRIILIILFVPAVPLWSQNADIRLLRHINLGRNAELDNSFLFISNSVTPLAVATPVLIAGVGLNHKDSVQLAHAVYIGAVLLSSTLITNALKYSIRRARPFETYPDIEKVAGGGSPSFPSGHTSDAFALATSLSLTYRKWYVVAPSFLWAAAVGYSRMDLGVHYPSDVVAGALVGAGSAYLCYHAQRWLFGNGTRSRKAGY